MIKIKISKATRELLLGQLAFDRCLSWDSTVLVSDSTSWPPAFRDSSSAPAGCLSRIEDGLSIEAAWSFRPSLPRSCRRSTCILPSGYPPPSSSTNCLLSEPFSAAKII